MPTHKEVFVPYKTKSQAGIEYTHSKKVLARRATPDEIREAENATDTKTKGNSD